MTIGLLDYQKARIEMHADNPVEARFRLNACAKEPWTAAWLERLRPGCTLWDIGANVGSYTLIAASRGLLVVAVEPAWPSFRRLRENVARNGLDRAVVPLQVALGEVSGPATVVYAKDRPGVALASQAPDAEQVREPALGICLDDLVAVFKLPLPHYVKLDTDGAEFRVLRGGRRVLSHPQVRSLLLEVPRPDEARMQQEVESLGFTNISRYDSRNGQPMQGVVYWVADRPE